MSRLAREHPDDPAMQTPQGQREFIEGHVPEPVHPSEVDPDLDAKIARYERDHPEDAEREP